MLFVLIDDQIITKSSMDFNLQEIIDNQNNQESVRENIKEELMETDTYENRSYSDITIDDTIEKQLNDL